MCCHSPRNAGNKKARPMMTGLSIAKQCCLDAIHIHNATGPGVQLNLEAVAMPTTEVGVDAATTLDCADAVEAASVNDCSAVTAADARIHSKSIPQPVRLRIPEAAKVEAEPIV